MKASVYLLIFLTCFLNTRPQTSAYETTLNAWHEKRIQDLKSPEGWLNLAGLYWLQPGRNSFGGGTANKLIYKNALMPASAGYFDWKGAAVTWHTAPEAAVHINGQAVQEAVVFHPDSASSPALALGPLRWFVIKREEKIGVRLRNLENPALKTFTGVNRFAVDSNWRITARLAPAVENRIAITNVLGQTSSLKTPGRLEFSIHNVTYTLDVLEEGPELFIIFGDATSGESTYPSGRFLYAAKPGPDGLTVLDFNKAINPPCAFTPFATCPLPPRQNILPVAITAGEKDFHIK